MNDNTITDKVVLDSVSAQIQQENQELPPLGSRWRSQNQRRYRKNNNNPQIQAINEEQNLGSDEIIETLHRRSIPVLGPQHPHRAMMALGQIRHQLAPLPMLLILLTKAVLKTRKSLILATVGLTMMT